MASETVWLLSEWTWLKSALLLCESIRKNRIINFRFYIHFYTGGIILSEQSKRSPYKMTDDDLEFLREHYPKRDWTCIKSRFPNLSKSAITQVASKNKISSNYKWTQHEIDILTKHYSTSDNDLLKSLLPNRSLCSIQTKAGKLGLKKVFPWTNEEDEILYEYYHKLPLNKICELLPSRTKEAIITHCMKLNLKGFTKYTSDEESFIIEHWEDLSDYELGIYLNKNRHAIQMKRLQMGLLRNQNRPLYSDLSNFIRGNIYEWKKRSMQNCNYKCVVTGDRFDDIHHIFSVNILIQETMNKIHLPSKKSFQDYSLDELDLILSTFISVQNSYPLDVCLRRDIHDLFHKIYGYGDNNLEQWNDFLSYIGNRVSIS